MFSVLTYWVQQFHLVHVSNTCVNKSSFNYLNLTIYILNTNYLLCTFLPLAWSLRYINAKDKNSYASNSWNKHKIRALSSTTFDKLLIKAHICLLCHTYMYVLCSGHAYLDFWIRLCSLEFVIFTKILKCNKKYFNLFTL